MHACTLNACTHAGDCLLELDGSSCLDCDKADIEERLSRNNGTVSLTVAYTTDYRKGLAHRCKVELEVRLQCACYRMLGLAWPGLAWLGSWLGLALPRTITASCVSAQAKLRRLITHHDQLEVEEQQLQHRIDVKKGLVSPEEPSGRRLEQGTGIRN